MLVKLAWDFSPDQLDHLFGCFQRSWVGASKKQRDELLDFIRHLAEDDKEGIMASKVLELLWNLAHRDDCPLDTMEHALNAHIKILDYSCSQVRLPSLPPPFSTLLPFLPPSLPPHMYHIYCIIVG